MPQIKKPAVLFLCTGNSCRSQMAEGWAKAFHQDRFAIYSAGIEAHGLNRLAVQVMQEAGVDISGQRSQRLEELSGMEFDLVITVCGHADKNCPTLPTTCQKLHLPFDDPPALARTSATEEEALQHYRRVRDEIRDFVERLPEFVVEEK
ncbi:MAG: arsenate reductase ArsC [Pirellulales bacterium]|nr:arsenate reductase ArsC [Pirellulales bacterium]